MQFTSLIYSKLPYDNRNSVDVCSDTAPFDFKNVWHMICNQQQYAAYQRRYFACIPALLHAWGAASSC